MTGKEKKNSKVGSDSEFAKPPIPSRFVFIVVICYRAAVYLLYMLENFCYQLNTIRILSTRWNFKVTSGVCKKGRDYLLMLRYAEIGFDWCELIYFDITLPCDELHNSILLRILGRKRSDDGVRKTRTREESSYSRDEAIAKWR